MSLALKASIIILKTMATSDDMDYESMPMEELRQVEQVLEARLEKTPFDKGNHIRTLKRHHKCMEKKLYSDEQNQQMETLIYDTKKTNGSSASLLPRVVSI